jgi:mannan endo-1,4-beta-mannosidase
MLNNLARRVTLIIQMSFFIVLMGSAVALATTSDQSASESSRRSKEISVQPLPWYGSVSGGVYITDPTPSSYEVMLKQKVSIVAWFVHWDEPIDNEKLAYACSRGYVPQITWESRKKDELQKTTYSLDKINAGDYDDFIRSELQSVKRICKDQPVIIRFDHEMDTDPGRVAWYPWQGKPDSYVKAWKRVVGIGHDVSQTIKWLWSPNRGVQATKLYYPGDEWVDYVGMTINRNPKQHLYTSFAVFYSHNQKVIESFNKPVMISETTYDEYGGTAESKVAWIQSMTQAIKANPRIVSFAWFRAHDGQAVDSSPQSIAALTDAFAALESK